MISGIVLDVYINAYTSNVFVLWESNSGRIYDINDTDVNCNDIKFWFHDLSPLLYHQQLNKNKTPFVFENLSYELVIDHPTIDISVDIVLKYECVSEIQTIASEIKTYLREFYTENNNHTKNLIHNFKYTIENNSIHFQIDTGITGIEFYKHFFMLLSDMNAFVQVNVS